MLDIIVQKILLNPYLCYANKPPKTGSYNCPQTYIVGTVLGVTSH